MVETIRDDNDIAAWCTHGGRLAAAAAAFPDAPRPWIDLSTGINPRGWDVGRAGPIDWRALPDEAGLAALEAAAAMHFGLAPDHVCAVPGSELGLRLLGAIGLPAPVRHVAPGYGTHAAVAPDGAIVPEALDDEAGCGGTILLANPNNPDGRSWQPEALTGIAARLAARNGVLIIDEAFAGCDPGNSLAPMLPDNAVVSRSFGKFFGLAGVRLGFVCATPTRLALLRERLGSWPVSSAAIAIGTVAYQDESWVEQTRARLRSDAARLDALLEAYGFIARGASPLFRLVETADARSLFLRLARNGILTRPFQYTSNWLRFGLPADEEGWKRLEKALRDG